MTAEALQTGIDFRKPSNDYHTTGRPSVTIDNTLDTIQTHQRSSGGNEINSIHKRANVSKAMEMNRVFPINLSYQL